MNVGGKTGPSPGSILHGAGNLRGFISLRVVPIQEVLTNPKSRSHHTIWTRNVKKFRRGRLRGDGEIPFNFYFLKI